MSFNLLEWIVCDDEKNIILLLGNLNYVLYVTLRRINKNIYQSLDINVPMKMAVFKLKEYETKNNVQKEITIPEPITTKIFNGAINYLYCTLMNLLKDAFDDEAFPRWVKIKEFYEDQFHEIKSGFAEVLVNIGKEIKLKEALRDAESTVNIDSSFLTPFYSDKVNGDSFDDLHSAMHELTKIIVSDDLKMCLCFLDKLSHKGPKIELDRGDNFYYPIRMHEFFDVIFLF